jgi:hypothetical protein
MKRVVFLTICLVLSVMNFYSYPNRKEYDVKFGFSDGLVWVRLNDKWGLIDETGKEVIPLKYDDIIFFSEGLVWVQLNDKWGLIDRTGKEVISLKYDNIYIEDFPEGLAAVKLDGKWGFIDETGKEIIPVKYDYIGDFSEGFATVKLDGKWGFIDEIGKEVIPVKYDYIGDFSEGLAAVKLDGKWGFIDETGKEVIPVKYDYIEDFSEGLAAVKLDGKWGFIDETGKEVISLKYEEASSFSLGLAAVKLDGVRSLIDETGKKFIPKDELKPIDQHTASIIQQIRSEYAMIVANKGRYKTEVVTIKEEEYEEGGSTNINVTYYIDNGDVRLIVYNLDCPGDDGSTYETIEYYLKKNHVFFVYRQNTHHHTPACPKGKCYRITIKEERIYYEADECIRHLVKEVEGKYSETSEDLLQKVANIEKNCEGSEYIEAVQDYLDER